MIDLQERDYISAATIVSDPSRRDKTVATFIQLAASGDDSCKRIVAATNALLNQLGFEDCFDVVAKGGFEWVVADDDAIDGIISAAGDRARLTTALRTLTGRNILPGDKSV